MSEASHENVTVKARPPFLRALGRRELPVRVRLGAVSYQREQIFKHDSFASTGLYVRHDAAADPPQPPVAMHLACEEADLPEQIVIKSNRQQSLFGFPMRWIGRLLAWRERIVYARTSDLAGVPAWLGQLDDTSVMHAYVPGRPLRPKDDASRQFLLDLRELVGAFHAREVAIVDLQKCENVIVGDDGRPYLLDFQISLPLAPRGIGRCWPVRFVYRIMVRGDRYHLIKHIHRFHPDMLGPDEIAQIKRKPFWIRLHRTLTRPLQNLRRGLLVKLAVRDRSGKAGSEKGVEEGLRPNPITREAPRGRDAES